MKHYSVLLNETIEQLNIKRNEAMLMIVTFSDFMLLYCNKL